MSRYKIISLDMFQTLVDVNSRCYYVWKQILGDSYSESLAQECWNEANDLVFKYFNDAIKEENSFHTTKHIFERCYSQIFPKKGIPLEPKLGAQILAMEHGNSDSFEDTEDFLKTIRKNHIICLVSDTDKDMVEPLLKRFNFDKVFLSEEHKCYKLNSNSHIFQEVINHYKVDPKNIIHIGDGYSDVIGANRAGINTCWINRRGATWKHEIKPDFIVESLSEVNKLL